MHEHKLTTFNLLILHSCEIKTDARIDRLIPFRLALSSRASCVVIKERFLQVLSSTYNKPVHQNTLPLRVISLVFLLCDHSFVFVACSTGLLTS